MKFLHRLAYYLGGFGIGLIILFFFLGGKKTSCDYGPNARVLKNIRIKERVFTEEALMTMNQNDIDTSAISRILNDGNVLFSESNTELDSCKHYKVEGELADKTLKIEVKNCEKIATILSLEEVSN